MQDTTAAAAAHPYQETIPGLSVAPQAVEVDRFGEPWIRTAQQYGRALHEGGRGVLALCQRTGYRAWREDLYPVEVALELLRYYEGKRDVYLSMQRFRARRTVAQILSLSSLYVDIDFYTTRYEGWHPYGLLTVAEDVLDREGIPRPTMAIVSGRGLYLIWQHHHVKRSALPRWDACQKRLQQLLGHMGADPQAKDAARVLRPVGTRHRATGAPVESLIPVGQVYDFDALARKILPREPRTQAQLHDLSIRRAASGAKRPLEATRRAPEDYNARTLWEARLTDLQRLRELRWAEHMMRDYRSRWMFLSGVAMGWTIGIQDYENARQVYRRELSDLALEAAGWHDRRTLSQLGTVIRRTEAAWRGEKVEYGGEERDPRYHLSNQRIIDDLEIDAHEESHMQTIISADTRRRRDNAEKERKRREAGIPERKGKWHAEAVRLRRDEGLPYRAIGERLGVSHTAVRKVLSRSLET